MSRQASSTFFESLLTANWPLAARTFGSSHATLIGVLADWWFKLDPGAHSVLDGAPSHGEGNAGWCDLMLCANALPLGVVEVEGTKPLDKLKTISAYFSSSRPDLSSLDFGLLLVYAYYARGRGRLKQYPPAETPEILAAALEVSASHPSKALLLLSLDKTVDPSPGTLRASSRYHLGRFARIGAALLVGGKIIDRKTLFEATPAS
jgi:hypothetical protein